MDALNASPLQDWKLETVCDDKLRYHRRTSGDECWHSEECIGSGSFGNVWRERCVSGPSQNALRAVKHLHRRRLKMSRRELDALVTFSDTKITEYKQHFVQFLGWFDDKSFVYIAMEYLENGDLQRYVGAPLPEPQAASIVAQVARALHYMHHRRFVHRDIKPENILVSRRGPNWHVKVTDFGISKNTDGTGLGTLGIGTDGYMAPELLKDDSDHYTPAVDVWALGAVAFCLQTGNPPFPTRARLRAYAKDPKVFPVEPLRTSSSYCMDFVRHTMQDIPERRSTIDYVLTHLWLSGSDAPESGKVVESSTTTENTFSLSPSNTWSTTYNSTDASNLRSFSSTIPIIEPEPELEPQPRPASFSASSSFAPLTTDIERLAVVDSPQRKDHLLGSPSTLYQKQKKSKQPDEVALIQEVLNSKNQGPLALINTLGLLLEFYRGHKRHEEAAEVEQQLRSLQAAMFMRSSTDTLGSPQNLIAMNHQPRFETEEVYEEDSELMTQQTTLNPEDIYEEDPELMTNLTTLNPEDIYEEEPELMTHLTTLKPEDIGSKGSVLKVKLTILGASNLEKIDLFRSPDPYVRFSLDGRYTCSTSISKRTRNPYWKEVVDIEINEDSQLLFWVYDSKSSKILGRAEFWPGKSETWNDDEPIRLSMENTKNRSYFVFKLCRKELYHQAGAEVITDPSGRYLTNFLSERTMERW